jgi:hypothetical protein
MKPEDRPEEIAQEVAQGAPAATSSLFDIIDVAGDTVIEVVADTGKELAGVATDAVSGGLSVDDRAEYYAKCVDDPERYPPLDNEMEAMAHVRRQYEEASRSLRGGEMSAEARAWNYDDRKEEYMAYQKAYSL